MTESHDSDEPDQRPRAPERIAVLEERMNTIRAETESAYDRLRADMAKRDAEAAKRETRLIVTMAGLMFGTVGAGVAFLAFLIRLIPSAPPV